MVYREVKNNKVIVKPNEINAYWRKQNNKQYARKRPDLQVRNAAKEYISKKDALADGEDNTELLENLLSRIREIFSGDGVIK